ncbi:MAG: TIGR03364 family FAD-dependent oxidoreductase [Bacteroidia bacterium]
MKQNPHFDLLVVGGGVLGTFHAYHALNLGLRVALVERNLVPIGATVRNFGQIVPSGMNLKWQNYGRQSLEVYHHLQAQTDISIRQNGSIYLASDAEELQLIEELHEINRANDYSSQLLTAQQCLAQYPSLKATYCKGGLFFPDEMSANPREMIRKVQAYLNTQPLFSHFPGTAISQIDHSGPGCIATDSRGNTYSAEKMVICSGSEFSLLYPELFAESDLEVVQLQMLRLAPQPSVQIPGNILTGLSIRRYESFADCPSWKAVKARETSDTFWKKWGVHILFKQEVDGSIILGDSHEYADVKERDSLDFDIKEEISRYFVEEGKKIFALDNWEIQTQWMGVYSQGKTHDIYQKTLDNKVFIVTGIGGKGMTASPGFSASHIQKIFSL